MSLAQQQQLMTFEDYLAWSARQERGRYEFIDGGIVEMPAEGVEHNRVKSALWMALREAVAAAGFAGEALADGMAIRTRGGARAREPDAMVSATRVAPKSLFVPDPLIVAEVVSPSSERDDTGDKLDEYFSVPTVAHYLIVRPEKQLIVHHARSTDGTVRTSFVTGQNLMLDPPGLSIDLTPVWEA
jgi:Uma2 family endonuclease